MRAFHLFHFVPDGKRPLLLVFETMQADVFIGNPSSTMSEFIAKSRVALGFEHNYLCLNSNVKSMADGAAVDNTPLPPKAFSANDGILVVDNAAADNDLPPPDDSAISYEHKSSRTVSDGKSIVDNTALNNAPLTPVVGVFVNDGISAAAKVAADNADFFVCGRAARHHPASWSRQQKYDACPRHGARRRRPLVLKGDRAFGGAGNRLRTFLRAMQYARDKQVPLVLVANSWAMRTLTSQFFAADGRNWIAQMEKSLCLKVLTKAPKLFKWTSSPKMLFYYQSTASKESQEASQLQIMRTLFRHHNAGMGHNDTAAKNMCVGIDALFMNVGMGEQARAGKEKDYRHSALYSAIYLANSKGKGETMLSQNVKKRGCDPRAAREMTPDYVKSILGPLGMLAHPIVVVVDRHKGSAAALRRLVSDQDLGRVIRVLPEEARWSGGDMTLAVMVSARNCIRGTHDIFSSF